MLDHAVVDSLFPADLPEPEHWEQRYPPRDLPEGAEVTRFGPSPTGFVHIGGVYVAMIDQDVSFRSGGRYLVRVEDTDQSREVEGALAQFERAFDYFHIQPTEGEGNGAYGPYHQSARESVYLTYVRHLLRQGRAYLCFATRDELADITARQQAAKVPPGYYGTWALWRDADPDRVRAELAKGSPYVVRFRAPDEAAGQRATFVDAIRGELSHEANRNDVVVLKSSDQPVRLPTYHFAHAVDDHLMRTTLVIRGEEWISSVPLHLQLFEALGFAPPRYAHIAPLMKQIPGGKRKLSKRKDPEASVDFYVSAGYPAEAVLYYLRGLANGRLAEMPLSQALTEPIHLAECGVAGPLVDLVKLEDISADHIATLTGEQILDALLVWAASHDPGLVPVLENNRDLALRALAVERVGVENPRKDLRKWSDFRPAYGFFFAELFTPVTDASDERLGGLDPELVTAFLADFADGYQPLADGREWFDQIRQLATKHGFAPNPKEFKKNPDAYPGSIREASQLVRVTLTGSTRSPDLHAVATTLGASEVQRRLRAVSR
ncbi:glutamate--tRNA ligase [Actinophytocola sp.]|uniref:glutamate--tRNA ligase n=1 Tax=Actinophytocola sp. TaxID=1872138 RepID=UPI00389AA07D